MKENKKIVLRDTMYNVGSYFAGDNALSQHDQNFDFVDFRDGLARIIMNINAPDMVSQRWITFFDKISRTLECTLTFTEKFTLGYVVPFKEASTYGNPDAVRGETFNWTMSMRAYETKVWDISPSDVKKTRKSYVDGEARLMRLFLENLKRALDSYFKTFIPALYKKALFDVPASGGTYASNFGLLHNTQVPEGMLVNYDPTAPVGSPDSNIRNHFIQISNPVSSIQPHDLDYIKNYLLSYKENESEQIIGLMHESDIRQLESYFKDPVRIDNILETGMLSKRFSGIEIIEADDLLPKGFAFFTTATKLNPLFSKLQHTDPQYQGINFDWGGTELFTWESVSEGNFTELKLAVGDTEVYVTGRFKGLFVDTKDRTGELTGPSQTINSEPVAMLDEVKSILKRKSDQEYLKLDYKLGQ